MEDALGLREVFTPAASPGNVKLRALFSTHVFETTSDQNNMTHMTVGLSSFLGPGRH